MLLPILVSISLMWLLAASIIDLKTKEVPDWLSYSLILISLSIQAVYSVIVNNPKFIFLGLVGLVIGTLLGSLMYYTKQWGGGDAKLLMGISLIYFNYPSSSIANIPFLLLILLNIIFVGTVYSLIWSLYLFIRNRKECSKKLKELRQKSKKIRNALCVVTILVALSVVMIDPSPITIPLILAPLLLYYLIISIKSVEAVAFYKTIPLSKLTEGDWITKDISIHNKIVYNSSSPGVTKEQINILRQHKLKEILIKEGIPFVPVFFLALVVSLIIGSIL